MSSNPGCLALYTGVVYPGFTQIVLDIGMELTIHMYT